MAPRPCRHKREEWAIFNAFLTAHPSFRAEVKTARQPEEEFPDIVVTLNDGTELDFELGEWLHGEQMTAAKQYECFTAALLDAIGPQGPNPSRYFAAVMLSPREFPARFDPRDRKGFKEALKSVIRETEERWPHERFWHSPQGRVCRDLRDRRPLGSYLRSVSFVPLVVSGQSSPWPSDQPWIFVEGLGGSFSPDTALQALFRILSQKIRQYGRLTRRTRLLVHYGKAVIYNTPYVGLRTRDFADVAEIVARAVSEQTTFDKIYLLKALQPGLEAFTIFPTCERCS